MIVFLVTLALNASVNWILTHDAATMQIGPALKIGTDQFVPIEIVNYSGRPIDKLKLAIPRSVDIRTIITTKPIEIKQVEHVVSLQQQNLIMLSALQPNELTRILIPIKSEFDLSSISAINARELRVYVKQSKDISYPVYEIVWSAVVNALVIVVIYSFVLWWLRGKEMIADEKVKDVKYRIEVIQKETDANHKTFMDQNKSIAEELKRTKEAHARIRLITSATISDLSKELQFWRDTIRKIIVTNTADKKTAENLITQITETLESWRTQGRITKDFEKLKLVVQMLSETEEGTKRVPPSGHKK
jgi:hypothetical protein